MKLKSLLAIVSCSAIALSISVPSIAEIVKDSQIKLEPTGIGNKDYRNKQFTSSIVGSWRALVNEKGVATNIYFNVKSDGMYNSIHHSNAGRGSGNGNWEYSNNLLTQIDNQGVQQGQGMIKWISNDEFLLTIEDNGDPYYEGVQRRYYRQKQAASTIQQDALRRARDSYGDVNNSWGEFNRSF